LERLNLEGFGLDLGDVGDTMAAQAAAMFHLKEWAAKELRVFNFKYFHDEIMKNPLRQDGTYLHLLTGSLTHSLIYSLTRWLTHSFTHWLTHSLAYSLTGLLTHSLTYLLLI
jgi:hypothetical protein